MPTIDGDTLIAPWRGKCLTLPGLKISINRARAIEPPPLTRIKHGPDRVVRVIR